MVDLLRSRLRFQWQCFIRDALFRPGVNPGYPVPIAPLDYYTSRPDPCKASTLPTTSPFPYCPSTHSIISPVNPIETAPASGAVLPDSLLSCGLSEPARNTDPTLSTFPSYVVHSPLSGMATYLCPYSRSVSWYAAQRYLHSSGRFPNRGERSTFCRSSGQLEIPPALRW